MNHSSLSRSEYAYRVYELLAANQVGANLAYDGDRTIRVSGVQAQCHYGATEISFPDPYTDDTVTLLLRTDQPCTAVAAVVEALLTTFASHLAFVAAEAAEASLEGVA